MGYMINVIKNIHVPQWLIYAALIVVVSTHFSPNWLLAIFSVFTGVFFFYLVAWKNLSNGILLWLISYLIFAQANVIQFQNLPNFPIERIIWALILLFFIAQVFTGDIVLLPITKTDWAILAFIIISIVSIIFAKGFLYAKELGFRDFLNGFAIPYTTYFISKNVFDSNQKVNRLLGVMCIVCAYTTISFIFEKLNLSHVLPHFYFANIHHGLYPGRFLGSFGNPAVCGVVIGITIHTTIYYQCLTSGIKKLLLNGLIFAAPVALFFTHTRSGWLGFVASTFLILILSRPLRPYLLVIVIGMLVVISVNIPNIMSKDRTKGGVLVTRTVESRTKLYPVYLKLFKEKPFFGQGFGEITHKDVVFADEEVSSHDTYMSILVEFGFVGFSLFSMIFLSIFFRSLKIYQDNSKKWWDNKNTYIVLFWAMTFNYAINAMIIEMRYFLFLNTLIFIFAGTVDREYYRKYL